MNTSKAARLQELVMQQLPALEEALRAARARCSEQSGEVRKVQTQLQDLFAERRVIEEQAHQLTERRERLVADRNALAADERRLPNLQAQLAAAQKSAAPAWEIQAQTLRHARLAEQTRSRGEQIAGDLTEVDAALEDLQERRVSAEDRFEELDMQLADSQERHAQLDQRLIEAERELANARAEQRQLELEEQAEAARRHKVK